MADEGEGPGRAELAGGRWSWQSWLGVVATCLAGMLCVVIVALGVVMVSVDSDMSGTSIFFVFTGLVIGPAVALWWTRNRYWYGFSGGVIIAWAALSLCG